jgi:hypothetical protein
MSYYITKSNGDALVTIEDGTVNTTVTDLVLFGKNYPTYGISLNQNFVKLLENFANIDEPPIPLFGQLWYNSNNKSLNVYREGSTTDLWKKLANVSESSEEPSENIQGDFWWDTSTGQLKVYNNTNWVVIGPQTTSTGLLKIVGTNDFSVQIGGTEVLKVDFNGNINKPLNPLMQATGQLGNTNFDTTDLSIYETWKPENVLTNIGSHFVKSTGIFTAPVAGFYRVYAQVTTLGSGSHSLTWQVNEVEYGISGLNQHTSGIQLLIASGIIQAAAGDEIKLVGSTSPGAVISHQNSSFNIELVS